MDKLKKINLVKREVAGNGYYGFNLGKKLVERIAPKARGIYILFSIENNHVVVRQISRNLKSCYRFEKNASGNIFLNIPSDIANNFVGKDFLLTVQDGFLEIRENKHLKKITESMKLDKKISGPAKEKKSKAPEKKQTVEQKILTENKKAPLTTGLIFNKRQLLALAELQAYTLENKLPCFEMLVSIPNYLNEKVFNEKELAALKSIVFYMAKNTFPNTDIHLVAQEIRDFLLANGQSEVQVILSFNKIDSEVA